MKNRILILMLSIVTLFACSTDSQITDDANLSIQNADLNHAIALPFKMSVSDGNWSVFPGDGVSCPALVLNAIGEGNATHLGLTTVFEEWCWNGNPDDLGTRSLTLTAANGDKLWGSHNFVQWTSATTFEEVLIFNGGTGRFENATGEIYEKVAITRGDETGTWGTFTLTAVGTLTY